MSMGVVRRTWVFTGISIISINLVGADTSRTHTTTGRGGSWTRVIASRSMESRRSDVAYEPMCISSYHLNRRRDTVLLGMELKLQQLRRSLSIIFNRGLQQQNCRKHRRSRAGEVCIYVKACGTRVEACDTRVEACGTHVKGTHVRGASYRFTTTCDNTSYTHTWRSSRRGSSSYLSDEFCSSFAIWWWLLMCLPADISNVSTLKNFEKMGRQFRWCSQ